MNINPAYINPILELSLLLIILIVIAKFLGIYMGKVFSQEKTLLDPLLKPIEKSIYFICRIDPALEQRWTEYTVSMLLFNLFGIVFLYLIYRNQGVLPLNPDHVPSLSPTLAFNLAISFTTNTNWQSIIPENAISYFSEMVGQTVQNFVSAATGISLAVAFIRAFARDSMETIGNFWADLVKSLLWILLPLSFLFSIILVSEGVIQNLNTDIEIVTIEGKKDVIPQGPVASRESIKMLGTNGGGFFNANSSHPFENPTPLTNFLQIIAMLSIGGALTYAFGYMIKDQKQGWVIFASMLILFLIGVCIVYFFELKGNPNFQKLGVDIAYSNLQPGGNMEGKEVRFGIIGAALFAVSTTAASCGAINCLHDSLTPIGGMIPLINIMLGEIIIGGVGAGFYGILIFAILTVFIAGLMVGRTPEYLGKKIESKEIKMSMLAILILPIIIHCFTALACIIPEGVKSVLNKGPHGFAEILYAFSSAVGNNGSAFAGLNANTNFYNLTTAIAMLVGRYISLIPTMAVAGSLVKKKIIPPSPGTFPTTNLLFVILLIGVILTVGGLIYFPALSLGPIVEHLIMNSGKAY